MSEDYPNWLKVIYELLSDKTKMQKSVCNPIFSEQSSPDLLYISIHDSVKVVKKKNESLQNLGN